MCEICNEVIQARYITKRDFLVCSNCLISENIKTLDHLVSVTK